MDGVRRHQVADGWRPWHAPRMSEPTKFLLGEDEIPTHWVNLLPDLPGEPLPPLNPSMFITAESRVASPTVPRNPSASRYSATVRSRFDTVSRTRASPGLADRPGEETKREAGQHQR